MLPSTTSLHTWDECPDWPYRYDFVAKACPPIDPASALPHVHRVPHAKSRIILYYHEIEGPNNFLHQRLSRLVRKPKTRLFFTAFVYDDPEHGERTVTREDLCAAFKTLVKHWHCFVSMEAELLNAIHRYPFKDRSKTDTRLYEVDSILTDGKGWGRLDALVPDIHLKLLSAAEYFGQYLSFLSDAEDQGLIPSVWAEYPGSIESRNIFLKSTGRYLMKRYNGTIDDYAFRAGLVLNGREA